MRDFKRVKSYFKKKYNTQRINVITKVTDSGNSKGSLDVGDKILDSAYQDNLVKEYLIDQDIIIDWDKLKRLDNKIEEKALEKSGSDTTNKFWAIKWIEFDNFLSFGEGNRLDFDKTEWYNRNRLNPIQLWRKNYTNRRPTTFFIL